MGKNVSQSSMKISKNDKKQLNSLIKVLRPKVYITDSSNFKRLVQELTGNGTTTITSSYESYPTKLPQTFEKVPVIDVEEHGQRESGMEVCFDALSDSFDFELCNQAFYPEELKQACNQIYFDDSSLENISMNQQADLLSYSDLESWLLDVEPYPCYNGYAQIEQAVSMYDYELSGLI